MKRWQTPLGALEVEIGEHGVTAVKLGDDGSASDVQVPDDLRELLDSHLRGQPGSGLALDLSGVTSPLAQLTLAKLLEIPYGEVRSYAWVAKEIGHSEAVRPVANAVAGNPVPVLVPCHRVVRSDGHIGEYSLGGPEAKRRLLELEGVDVNWLEELAAHRVRFLADKESGIFHLPTCRIATRLDRSMMVEIKNIAQAEADLRPCPRCRP